MLKSHKKIYQHAHNEKATNVNDYNPCLLLLWKGNMDIRFVAESLLALAYYVSGYVTNAKRSNMEDIWREVGETKSAYGSLWNSGI